LKFEAIEYQVLLPSNQNSLPGNAKVYSECLLYRLAMQIAHANLFPNGTFDLLKLKMNLNLCFLCDLATQLLVRVTMQLLEKSSEKKLIFSPDKMDAANIAATKVFVNKCDRQNKIKIFSPDFSFPVFELRRSNPVKLVFHPLFLFSIIITNFF